jgi:hypothetical protein
MTRVVKFYLKQNRVSEALISLSHSTVMFCVESGQRVLEAPSRKTLHKNRVGGVWAECLKVKALYCGSSPSTTKKKKKKRKSQ